MLSVRWPTIAIAADRGTPARSRFRTAERRKSCGTARTAEDIPCENWVTIAASESTRTSPPSLRPALPPANAGKTNPEWAGTCDGCKIPIWARVALDRNQPRLCPACRKDRIAQDRRVGAPVFRRTPSTAAECSTLGEGLAARRRLAQAATLRYEGSRGGESDGRCVERKKGGADCGVSLGTYRRGDGHEAHLA